MRRAYYLSAGPSRIAATAYFGRGVGVAGPKRRYFSSIAARIAAVDLPSDFMRITSRVMSRQSVQVAAWLVNVTRAADSLFT